jgi:hypothetical protein
MKPSKASSLQTLLAFSLVFNCVPSHASITNAPVPHRVLV